MHAECYPISSLPGTSALFRDFAEGWASAPSLLLRQWYRADPFTMEWAGSAPSLTEPHREALAAELRRQATIFQAGPSAIKHIEALRTGAAAVVTGQQVGLFGGPLLTLLKAATAIRKAQDATRLTGRPHVPIFWLATEDHDVEEIDQVHLLTKSAVTTLRAGLGQAGQPAPVGALAVNQGVAGALDQLEELLAFAPVCDAVRRAYTPSADGEPVTLAVGFGRLLSHNFAEHGLVVMDAAGRVLHSLGEPVLRSAIENADALEAELLRRSAELEGHGYHAQVKVAAGMSLLFLVQPGPNGLSERRALRRTADGVWKTGQRSWSTAELLQLLEREPEAFSPNALLRPVMQDAILPTSAYIGGPAEVAYFAQASVVYERILGRVTAIVPRLSATLVDPESAAVMARHELQFPDIVAAGETDTLALRMGARAMPVQGKQRLAAAGNAMDTELTALESYMAELSADLGRAAALSGRKMRYQMNRLRRMAARFEVERHTSLHKQALALMLHLYPEAHLQERLLAGVLFLAKFGESLPAVLVEHAGQECPGHRVLWL